MPDLLVNIDVEDIARATAFYEAALGLAVRRRLFGGSVVELEGASSLVYLLEKPASSPASATSTTRRDYRRHWTPVHLDIVVDDLEAAIARAVAAGATQEGETGHAAWGSIAHFTDPFGHGFCLVRFSEQGYGAAP